MPEESLNDKRDIIYKKMESAILELITIDLEKYKNKIVEYQGAFYYSYGNIYEWGHGPWDAIIILHPHLKGPPPRPNSSFSPDETKEVSLYLLHRIRIIADIKTGE